MSDESRSTLHSSLITHHSSLMKVIFVNRYFHPDHSATSQMVSDLAFHLASRGWEVGAITSRQRYDDASAQLPARETVRGVAVRRVGAHPLSPGPPPAGRGPPVRGS